jgi:hypothetical protein
MRRSKAPFIAVVLLTGCGLTACDRYLDRRDQVTFGVGDSIAANKAAQIIDPWPAAARTVEQGISGEQAEAALDKLRRSASGKDGEQKPPTLTLTPTPVAPPR